MDISEEAIDAKFSNENAADQDRDNRFVGVCAVEMHMDISEEVVYAKKSGKLLQAKTGTTVLCERAQSKCTWTSDKEHFMREFSGITPTWTSHKNNFHAETRTPMEQPDQAPALALAVRTPQCGHIVWGTTVLSPIHNFEEGREEL